MKRYAASLLVLLIICMNSVAVACGTYVLIPDSDTRLLFEEEVRGYHADTLDYVLNEILARHGYHFDPEGIYLDHFERLGYVYPCDSGFPYREAPEDVSNEEILINLSDVEHSNIALIKRIQEEKRENKDDSGFYADWCCEEIPSIPTVGYGWTEIELPINLKIPVYSGPGEQYLRGAEGKAFVSTNGSVKAFGFDGDWLMITYLIDAETKQARIGYINKDAFGRELNSEPCVDPENQGGLICYQHCEPFTQMDFSRTEMPLVAEAALTDEPAGLQTPLIQLEEGEMVTLLCKFPLDEDLSEGKEQWLYVEYAGEMPMRGFIPADCIQ